MKKFYLIALFSCIFSIVQAQPYCLYYNYGNLGSTHTISFAGAYPFHHINIPGCYGTFAYENILKFTPTVAGKYVLEMTNMTSSNTSGWGNTEINLAFRESNGLCDYNNYVCLQYDSVQNNFYNVYYYTVDILFPGITYDILFIPVDSFASGDVEVTINCAPPTNINLVSDISSAIINFTCNCPNSTYLEYGLKGFIPGDDANAGGGTVISNVTSPYNLTGLTPNSHYDVYLRSVCGGSFSFNKLTSFRTLNDCANAPVIDCSSYIEYNNNEGVAPFTGNWENYGCGYSSNNSVEKIFRFTPTVSGIHTILFYATFGWVAPNASIYYKEVTGTCDENNWICVTDISQSAPQVISWGPLTAGTNYLLLLDGHYSPFLWGRKYFRIDCPNVCSTPHIDSTNINITNNSVTITGCGSCATNMIIEYGLSGFTPGTGATMGVGGTVITNVSLPVTINNLIPGTTYDVYARNSCGTPAGFSLNTDVVTFTTLSCTLPLASVTASGPTTFCQGNSVTLNANTGIGLSYQWKKNGNNIFGATTSSYNSNSSGNYSVVVTNTCGSSTSNVISVNDTSISSLSPSLGGGLFTTLGYYPCPNQCNGSLFVLDSLITGSPPYSYSHSWAGNLNVISGGISITNLCESDYVEIIVTDANGCTGSDFYIVGSVPTQNPTITITPACNQNNGSITVSNLIGAAWNCDAIRILDDNYSFIINGSGMPISLPAGNYILETYCSSSLLPTGPCSQYFPFTIPGGITPASITASGSTSLCNGSTVTLNANTGTGLSYQWQLNGNNISGATSSSYSASAAGNYAVFVTDSCGSNTSNIITVSVGSAPNASITASGSTSICVGNSVLLNANTGTGLSYQWKLNGNNISGATTSSYSASNAGNYTAVVSNACGSSTSNIISVTTGAAPSAAITASGSTSICAGSSVTLNANTGTGLSYQWQLNGNNISGAITSSYSASNAGNYTAVVSNACGSSTSNIISVTTGAAPSAAITASGSTSICAGSSVTLNANTGTGLTYQWQLNGNNISGATASSYSAGSTGNYTAVVSNTCGSSTSNVISVTTGAAPSAAITASGSTSVCAGSSVTLNANTGTGLTYQWQLNGNNISGEIFSSFSATTSGNYSVIVTNSCGNSVSNIISISVISALGSAGAISGPTSFCRHSTQSFSVSPVTGATNYTWTVPPQATIISGLGTNSVVISFIVKQGDITVKASNSCGSGPLSVLPVQLLKCANPNSNNPNNPLRTAFNTVVYPNPSLDDFNCEIHGESDQIFSLRVFDYSGRIVELKENIVSNKNFTFGNDLAPGFYFVEIKSGEDKEIYKVVKVK